jgi:hypothetical protein
MIKICKKPKIIHNEDRWGQEMPGYYLYNPVGYIDHQKWEDIYRFERYSILPEAQDEIKRMAIAINQGAEVKDLDMPPMTYLLGLSKTQLLQFNLRITEEDKDDEAHYARNIALFDAVKDKDWYDMFELWTPEHDEEVKKLEAELLILNQ